jgi:3-hydroxybutyrate dehydrogenase
MPTTPKVILVTGSTSGIGLAVAAYLAGSFRQSHLPHVMLNGFGTAEEVAAATRQVQAAGGADAVVRYCGADLSTAAGVEQLISATVAAFGTLHVLVNNAGVQFVAPIEEFPAVQYDRVVAINQSAVFHAIRLAVPLMKRHGGPARIITVASVHGLQASPFKSAYVGTKHFVMGLSKCVALELAETNITSNVVCPGWVLTPLVEKQIRARMAAKGTTFAVETKALVSEKMPSGRPADPAEIGAAVAYLAADAAKSTTGTAMVADGGWSAGTVVASEREMLSKL